MQISFQPSVHPVHSEDASRVLPTWLDFSDRPVLYGGSINRDVSLNDISLNNVSLHDVYLNENVESVSGKGWRSLNRDK